MALDDEIYTIKELSEHLRVHRATIYRLLRQGRLPGFRVGGDWRFTGTPATSRSRTASARRVGPDRVDQPALGRTRLALTSASTVLRSYRSSPSSFSTPRPSRARFRACPLPADPRFYSTAAALAKIKRK